MALTYSPEVEIGTPCPDFSLLAVNSKRYQRSDFNQSQALVVMFICNHCPYVQAIEDRLIQLGLDFSNHPVSIIAICSNDSQNYPDDSFENLKKRWEEKKYPFPYLYDPTQKTAKAFGAVCTPDFFVYDKDQKLAYRGRLDDSWKDPNQVQSQDLKQAILSLLEGKAPQKQQHPSMGCSIKWISNN